MQKKYLMIIVALGAVLILGAGLLYYFRSQFVTKSQSQLSTPPAGHIIIRGTVGCLPHKNTSGPQTLECAFGLKDEKGTYYGLGDTDGNYRNLADAPKGENNLVEVEGVFTPEQSKIYQGIGTILVTRITLVITNSPQPSASPLPTIRPSTLLSSPTPSPTAVKPSATPPGQAKKNSGR